MGAERTLKKVLMIVPVSYTHLDVYKRQSLRRARAHWAHGRARVRPAICSPSYDLELTQGQAN